MREQQYRTAERRLWEWAGIEPSERWITLGSTGTRLRILEVGSGDPVLFIHGGTNAGSTWVPMVRHLDGFRCLLVDRPGTGLSEPCPITASSLPDFGAGFIGGVLDGLGLDRADLVASSFGGHLALRSAAAHPDRIVRMTQMGAPALLAGQVIPPFMRSLRSSVARAVMNALPSSKRINRSILRQIGHGASLDAGRIDEVFLDWYQALGRHTDTMRHEGRMIGAELLPNLDALTLTDELLRSVTTPTLLLWGAADSFGGEEDARRLAGHLPNADLVMMPAAGHLPWLDDPAFAAESITRFLVDDRARPHHTG